MTLVGRSFGSSVVVRSAPQLPNGRSAWVLACSCGAEYQQPQYRLMATGTTGCPECARKRKFRAMGCRYIAKRKAP